MRVPARPRLRRNRGRDGPRGRPRNFLKCVRSRTTPARSASPPHAPRLRDVLRVFVLRRRHPAPVSALRLDWERTSGAPPPAGPSADTGAVKAVAGSSRRRFSSTLVDTRRLPVDAGGAPPGRPSVPAGPSSGAFPPQFSSRPVTFRCENAIISSVENSRRNGPLVRSSAPRAGTRAENLFRS